MYAPIDWPIFVRMVSGRSLSPMMKQSVQYVGLTLTVDLPR